jgi:hypothetical protein
MFGIVSVVLAKCMLHSQSVCRTLLPHALANASLGFFLVFPCVSLCFVCSSFPCFPTYSRSCNGHAPLLIRKGPARAGQKVQPRQVGQNSAPNSSIALGRGKKEMFGKVAEFLSHSFFANVLLKVITYSHNFSRTHSFHFVAIHLFFALCSTT